jgi:copper(I)-binding protein
MMRLLPGVLLMTALGAASLSANAATAPAPAPAATQATTNDAVTVRDAWARATAPGMSVGAVYLTLQGGAKADSLIAAATARAGMTQIHVVTAADGMARMRETEAVDVPAGKRVLLAPQGTHIMLMRLTQPLVARERFVLTLTFAKAGKREVSVQVVAPDAEPPSPR